MFLRQIRAHYKIAAAGGSATLWFVLMTSCLEQLPETVVGCTAGSQCASGKCENGECVPGLIFLDSQNTDQGSPRLGDAKGDGHLGDGGDDKDVNQYCSEDDDCQHLAKGLGARRKA